MVVSSPLVLRVIAIWLNGGPRLLSRFVASMSEAKSWLKVIVESAVGQRVRTVDRPAGRDDVVGGQFVGQVGTAATTSASAVATSVIVPVPSGSTVMSTLRSTRHPASAATHTHRARTRRTTVTSMADGGR